MKLSLRYRRKNICFLFVFLSSAFNFYGQDILWEKSLGGLHAEFLTDLQPTPDYGFIVAGSSLSGKSGNRVDLNQGNLDYCIWKLSEKGGIEWQKTFGGSGSDFLSSIKLTPDGGFVLAGTSDSPISQSKKDSCRGFGDYWIIKLNAKGDEQWQKTIGGKSYDHLKDILLTDDGGYILGGSSESHRSGEKKSSGKGGQDYWVVKLNNKGDLEWEKTFGGVYLDELRAIEQTQDKGYILGGYSNSPVSGDKTEENVGIGDYWIIKLDKKGSQQWQRVIGGNKDDQLYTIHQTFDGGYILGGNSDSDASYNKTKANGKEVDFWVVKLDGDGQLKWQETYDFGKIDVLSSIIEEENHTYLIGGFAKSDTSESHKKDKKGTNDYIALKVSETGERLWDASVGSDGDDLLRKVIETRDGGYVLAGTSNPVKNGPQPKSSPGKSGSLLPTPQANEPVPATRDNVYQEQITEAKENANAAYNEATGKAADKLKNLTNTGDSAAKVNFSKPTANLPIGSGSGDTLSPESVLGGLSSKAQSPASGDKKTNYGNNDFWVVKLLDRNKPKNERQIIEAIPNPAKDFTNVIVGYEYESGTATIFDLAGHQLDSFPITGRTVPVDLSPYPDGMYIVNIKTNKQTDGVKVIKGTH